jgi:hypothetical protein
MAKDTNGNKHHVDLPIQHDIGLRAAIDAARRLHKAPLSFEERADSIVAKFMDLTFPSPVEANAMRQELLNYVEVGTGLRLNGDGPALLREAMKLYQRAMELTRPKPEPAPPRSLDVAMNTYA